MERRCIKRQTDKIKKKRLSVREKNELEKVRS